MENLTMVENITTHGWHVRYECKPKGERDWFKGVLIIDAVFYFQCIHFVILSFKITDG